MKLKFYIPLFLLGIFFTLGNSGGAGAIQGVDRTGSPVGDGACNTCHNGGGFDPASTLELISNGTVVTAYEPGMTYTVRIATTATGTPAGYGFQTVALDANNGGAGTFVAGSGYSVLDLFGRGYAEQASTSADNTFNVTWTAPEAGAGDVIFYASTSTVNGNGMASGDNGAILPAVTITEAEGSSTDNLGVQKMELSIMPNPVGDVANFKAISQDNGTFELRVMDIFGKVFTTQKIELTTGENIQSIPVNNLPKGVYILQISGENYFSAEQMLKL